MQIWITVHNYTFFPAPKMPFLVCSAAWGWPYLYCTGFTVQENSYKKHTGKKKKILYQRVWNRQCIDCLLANRIHRFRGVFMETILNWWGVFLLNRDLLRPFLQVKFDTGNEVLICWFFFCWACIRLSSFSLYTRHKHELLTQASNRLLHNDYFLPLGPKCHQCRSTFDCSQGPNGRLTKVATRKSHQIYSRLHSECQLKAEPPLS